MLVNQLLIAILNENNEIIETPHDSLEPHSVGEKDDNRYLLLPQMIKIDILDVMISALGHAFLTTLPSPLPLRHISGHSGMPRSKFLLTTIKHFA